jgi:hypothetical protein
MELSEHAVSVLKNFSQINPSVLFKPGQEVSTISPQKTVIATAIVDETFPVAGGIYDLNRFLGVLTLFESPELEFNEHRVTISEGRKAINYTFAEPSMILTPPEKKIDFPDPEVSVEITWNEIQSVLRAASVMQLPEVSIIGRNGQVQIAAEDSKNPTADTYGSGIGETENEFKFVFKVENLKLLNLNYMVEISRKGIAKFTSTNELGPKLEYFIATEANSSYTGE